MDMTEPMHILSLGAGVQSSTLALMAAKGEVTPMPTCAIFADTQAEPASVYTWLDWLEGELPFPVHRVTAGSLTEDLLTLREKKDKSSYYIRTGVPAYMVNPDGSHGHVQRQCTYQFKLLPLDKASRRLGEVKRGEKKVRVVQWIGISLDEVRRMKPSRHKWMENRWPLIEKRLSRHDCMEWMESNGYPKPPRSACLYCPYHSNVEWRRLRDEEPEAWAEAIRVEREFQRLKEQTPFRGVPYFHASRVPLDQVDLETDLDKGQMSLFDNDCEGMCGV